jgi:hypothetical protein
MHFPNQARKEKIAGSLGSVGLFNRHSLTVFV